METGTEVGAVSLMAEAGRRFENRSILSIKNNDNHSSSPTIPWPFVSSQEAVMGEEAKGRGGRYSGGD